MLINVPVSFLHALTDEEISMLLQGPLAEMVIMIDPSLYPKYITSDSKGVVLLYVKKTRPCMAYSNQPSYSIRN